MCVSSGTVLHSEIKSNFKENIGILISDLYGVAETGFCILNMTENMDTVGKAVANVQIAIMNDQGNSLSPYEQGEIAIKSKAMARAYYNFPGLFEERITNKGYYLSGDIAYKDKDDYVFIQGRKQDFVDVAGKKVDPKEVEELLLKFDKIKDVAVFGQLNPDTKQERLCAAIVTEHNLQRVDIVSFLQDKLTSYKIPQWIVFMDKLPRNSYGKVLRRELATMTEGQVYTIPSGIES